MVAQGVLERAGIAAMCLILVSSILTVCVCGHDATPSLTAGEQEADAISRTVDYRWYDFFNVPLGDWWFARTTISEAYVDPLTDEFPFIFTKTLNYTHHETYANARLSVTGVDLPELNMNARPQFLPLLGNARGGTAVIDWYMQYLSEDDLLKYFRTPPPDWGWIVCLNGTVRLDKTAAMAVMNITGEEFDDFDAWWEVNEDVYLLQFAEWLLAEGNDRLDISSMYEYPLFLRGIGTYAERAGNEIILTYDHIVYGMECLMTRWLHDAFMPTEWWFEDFTMHAEIGPESADIEIDTAVSYAVRVWETTEASEPCWVWEGMLQDIPNPDPELPHNQYSYLEYTCHLPGSPWYGLMVPYDYTPGCWNLSKGETLVITWPDAPIPFTEHVDTSVTSNITAPAMAAYFEPMPSDMAGSIDLSPALRTVSFLGPIDFWTWSLDQDEHEYLSSEWDRLGVLPRGMPYVELSIWDSDTPPVAYLEARRSPDASSASQYVLNASLSCDSEDDLEDLRFRWDLDGDGTMDTDWAGEPVIEHDFGDAGTFEVSVSVKDSDNMTDVASTQVVIREIDPPATSLHMSGTEGENGWYISWVTVELSAEDDTGIGVTMYRIDGGPWQTYNEEFEVEADGVRLLEFFSVDVESNYEEVQETTVKVDMTPPEVSFVTQDDAYPSDEVVIAWTCTDSTSGFNGSMISLDGQSPEWIGTNLTHTYSDVGDGTHTVTLVASDNAGNAETYSYTFTVTDGPRVSQTLVVLVVICIIVLAVIVLLALWSILRKPPVVQ